MKYAIAIMVFVTLCLAALSAQAKTVHVEGLNTLKFRPQSITVEPGEQITIRFANNTRLPAAAMSHNWILLAAGADAYQIARAGVSAGRSHAYIPRGMDDQILAYTGLVAGGASDTVTFKAPDKPGSYEYICTFPGHFSAGMRGALVVKPE